MLLPKQVARGRESGAEGVAGSPDGRADFAGAGRRGRTAFLLMPRSRSFTQLDHDSMSPLQRRLFHGALIHSTSLTELEVLPSALLGVDDAGVIAFLDKAVPADKVAAAIKAYGWERAELVSLKHGEFLCPG